MDLGTAMIVIAGIGAYYSLRSQRLRQRGDARDNRAGESHQGGLYLRRLAARRTNCYARFQHHLRG